MTIFTFLKKLIKFITPYGILKIYKHYIEYKIFDDVNNNTLKEVNNELLGLKVLFYNTFSQEKFKGQIKVSVIIPVYNMEKFLGECLESVLNQTLKEIEVIIINDGSIDKSLQIAESYSKNDRRIRILNQKNHGVGFSRNLGINTAKGEFICFIDADDIYPEADVLECLYSCAKLYSVDICGGEFSVFTSDNKKFTQNFIKSLDGYLFDKSRFINYSEYQFDYGYHRFLYNRQMLITKGIYFPELSRFQDPPFFVRAMMASKKFYAVKKNVYGYRLEHKQLKWTNTKIADFLEGINCNIEIALENGYSRLLNYSYYRFKEHINAFKGIEISNENRAQIYRIANKFEQKNIEGNRNFIGKMKKIFSQNTSRQTL